MYYQHFGLSGSPFQFTPSPKLLYLSETHREGLAALEWGLLHEPSGFTLLIGETGTGKTTLVWSILARQYERVRTLCIINPKLSFDEMLRSIVSQLGIAAVGPTKLHLVNALNHFFSKLASGHRVAIIIDEAQDVGDETLEELRLLSNYGRAEEKQLQFILVGQPELLRRLMAPGLHQFNQRVGARAMLVPLKPRESRTYIDYRLHAHNGSADSVFTRRALHCLVARSGGLPRRINVLCHNALLAAYAAGARRVSAKIVRQVAREYEDITASRLDALARLRRAAKPWVGRVARPALTLAVLALLSLGAVYFWTYELRPQSEPVVRSNFVSAAVLRPIAAPSAAPAAPALPPAAAAPKAAEAGGATAPMGGPATRVVFATEPAPSRAPAALAIAVEPPADGLTHAESEAKPEAAPAPKRRIRVHYGDTLGKIAIRYLGSQDGIDALIDANPQLANINRIYPGDYLYLPPADRVAKQE